MKLSPYPSSAANNSRNGSSKPGSTSSPCSAHDAGLAEFQQLLAYKAEEAGTRVVLVNPAYTSQACSAYGGVVPKELSVRVHVCPDCGLTLDRDVNAAHLSLRPGH